MMWLRTAPTHTHRAVHSPANFSARADLHIAYVSYRWRSLCEVEKWGNDLAIRLPAAVVEALGLKEGDEIELSVTGMRGNGAHLASPAREELLKRLRAFRGRLPGDFKFDRDETSAR